MFAICSFSAFGVGLLPAGPAAWFENRSGFGLFTSEPTAGHLHIRIGSANPTVRTRKHEVVSCSVADLFPIRLRKNIAAEKAKLEAQLAQLNPGPQRDGLLKKIRQLDTASHMNEWLTSPGLRPPEPA
jgi:hypothetical protein